MFYIKVMGTEEINGEPKSGGYSMYSCLDYLVANSNQGTSLILDNTTEEGKRYLTVDSPVYVMNIKGETIDTVYPRRFSSGIASSS